MSAPASPSDPQEPQQDKNPSRGLTFGRFRLRAVETGRFALDGGAMFGVVPKTLWDRRISADDQNRIPLAARSLLIEELDGPRKILVDTGCGDKWSPKMASIYGIDHSELSLETGLKQVGLAPGDITDVLITHLHFDHAGGNTKPLPSSAASGSSDGAKDHGELVPTFPNARYHVQARNLDWARSPVPKDRASYLPENFEPLANHTVLETVDGAGVFLEGLELVTCDGHTQGMQLPLLHGERGARLLYCADLIPTAAHVPIPWVMAYDNQPLVTMQEKEKLLGRAAEENWILFYEHDRDIPATRVQEGPKGFSAGDRVHL